MNPSVVRRLASQLLATTCKEGKEIRHEKLPTLIDVLARRRPYGRRMTLRIARAILRLARVDARKRTLVIESPIPIERKNRARLVRALEEKCQRRFVHITESRDPTLIAGLRIQVADDVWETSMDGYLRAFIEKVRHG